MLGMIAAIKKASEMAKASKNTAKSSSSGGSSTSSGKTSGLFDPDFENAEAIAASDDPEQRARLLNERQAKMDALGLNGKTASNEAVSQWSGSYRPYYFTNGQETKLNVVSLYDSAAKARLQAFERAMQQSRQQKEQDLAQIEQDYRAGMTQTGVNARQSALSNAEKLAALGLSMSGAYAAPTSGYTESSRVAADNAYRRDLNSLTTARLNARAAAVQAAAERENSLLGGYWTGESNAALQQAQATLAQYNTNRDYSISLAGLTGYLNGMPTLARQQAYSQMQAENEKTAYARAVERWKTYGYVLPGDAGLLGVAAGTPTSDQSYRTAQLKLNQIKTNYQISK